MGIFNFIKSVIEEKPDLETIEGINSIKIPVYKKLSSGVSSPTNNIEYILQRKATEHKRNGCMDLAIACLRKSNEIMPHSNFAWSSDDYLRLVEFLKDDGQFEEARKEEAKIKSYFESSNSSLSAFLKTLKTAKELKTDLLEMSTHECTCAECSKYQGRIFSISGKDKNFPKLPDFILKTGQIHEDCHHVFYPYLAMAYSKSELIKIIKFSNRPFVDSRSKKEKLEYEQNKLEAETYERDKQNYDLIREHLPDIAPKSFNGYRKMKSAKSKNFVKLAEKAKEIGLKI